MNYLSAFGSSLGSALFTILAFLFVLSIVVVIHELGHFLVARWCGVKVDAFAMGFGREVYGWNDSKGTRWRLNWIPLGGYVKFMDDANGASIPDAEIIANMSAEERATSFHAKPLWQRAAVIFAGPFANFLLAVVLLGGMSMAYGVRTAPPRVEVVVAGGAAERAGLQGGDLITKVDGAAIKTYEDLMQIVFTSPGQPLKLTFERDGKLNTATLLPDAKEESDGMSGKLKYGTIGITFPARIKKIVADSPAAHAGLAAGDVITGINATKIADFLQLQKIVSVSPGRDLVLSYERAGKSYDVHVTPEAKPQTNAQGENVVVGILGLQSDNAPSATTWRRYGPIEAVQLGITKSSTFLVQNILGLRQMIATGDNVDQIGGPAKIAAMAGQAASMGFDVLLNLAVAISLSVGFFNLLPVPPLDGGHLMFYAAEAVRGRPLSDRVQGLFLRVGLSMIATLFVFLMWNDRGVLKHWLGG